MIQKVLIIDDETRARHLLTTILQEYCHEIMEIHEAPDLISGVEKIRQLRPGIVFLDIEMPEYSGLQLLDFIPSGEIDFEIIFTTAYSEYAIKAFKFSAIDYLLKPLRPAQVKEAVAKASQMLNKSHIQDRLQQLMSMYKSESFKKVALPVSDGIYFMNPEEIMCLEANGMYTKVFSVNQPELLISKPLKHFEYLLNTSDIFYRPHRSFLINLKFVKQYVKKEGNYIVMDNCKQVPISREKRGEFLALVSHL